MTIETANNVLEIIAAIMILIVGSYSLYQLNKFKNLFNQYIKERKEE